MNKKLSWIYNGLALFSVALVMLMSSVNAAASQSDKKQTAKKTTAVAQVGRDRPIKIVPKKKHRIEEFRVNGVVVMIRITPKKGAAYFLVDSNGDGDLNTRSPDFSPELLIPQWVLFRW